MNDKVVMVAANDTTFIYKLRKEILQEFLRQGYDVIVVAKKLKFVREIESMGCSIIDLKLNRTGTSIFSDISLLRQIRNILENNKPDIVFTNSIKPNVYFGIVCNSMNIPFVPNITGLGRALEYPGILQKISVMLYRVGMRGANIILFQNEFNRDFFLKKNIIKDTKKYIILPGSGVNTNDYKKLDYPTSEKVNFLFISRIRKEKGIDYFMNAATTLNKKYKDIMFNVCGLCEDDDYLDKFTKLEKEGFFKYYGEQADLTPFYQSASCIVHPTYYPEGMSNVLLEAGSHGRPIITTDRPGCKEIVKDGYNGYMINIKSQSQLNDAIERFLSLSVNQKRKMGENGRNNIEQNFDRQLVVDEYVKIVDDILYS